MSSQLKAWGLYRADSSNAVPLKSLDISIKIFHNVARVIYSQEYFNDTDLLIETEFFFPISPEACFDSFEATFNNTTIKGVVKEKEKAKEEYKEAIKQGRTAAYSEINKETGDIMKVQIGNIPQNTSIKVTYSYIQKLETSLNKFWCFRLFSTLTPRYNSMTNSLQAFLDHDVTLLSSYPTISKNDSQAYPWSIQAEIHSPSPLTFLKSPSHDIVTTYGNENHTCTVTLNSNKKHLPNKDFVLLFSNGRESNVDYLLTPFEDGYCAMVSLIADFEKSSNEQAFEDFAKAKEAENLPSMSTVRGEYIFLIDRSGSMDGERITMARNSLVLFLKSLPKDSLFNVVSFGSDYQFLYDESLAYSQENIDSSTKKIQKFDANMGGTEIYSALLQIFTAPPKKGYPRFVFLLTDGAVSDTQNVLNLIASNSDQSRTFTIGIGNGCSPELISKGAAYGRGKAEFVADTNQIFEKVISLLNASLSPCYSDLSLQADNFDAVVKSVTPNPTSIPFLINGQTVTFFLFLRSAAFEDSKKMNLQLQMYDSRKKKSQTVEIALDASEAIENELIPKLAIHDMIKRLEIQKEKSISKKDEIILWMDKEDLEKAMTQYSLKFGILCKETAFFCEACDSETKMKNVIPTKIVVPTVLSQDYDSPLLGTPPSGFGGGSRRNRKSSGTNLTSPFNCVYPIRSGGGGQRMAAPSYDKGSKDEDAMLCDLLESLGSTTTALKEQQSSMSAELSYQSDICLPEARLEKASATQSGGLFKGVAKGISNAFGSLTSKLSRSSQKEKVSTTSATYESSRRAPSDTNTFEDFSFQPSSSTISSQPQNKSTGQYLDIIMKQTVEGFWDPKDSAIRKAILKDSSKLPQLPSQIQIADAAKAEAVWITILIMRWLELACKDDRKAWLLIYQKGYEWLEGQGVDYDAVKDLGTSFINI